MKIKNILYNTALSSIYYREDLERDLVLPSEDVGIGDIPLDEYLLGIRKLAGYAEVGHRMILADRNPT